MAKVKITVVKRVHNQDLIAQYGKNPIPPCDRFSEGQEFVTSEAMPEGFCPWAWADISRDAAIVQFGGNPPWIKQPGTHIVCCSDGLRPVVFKVERIE